MAAPALQPCQSTVCTPDGRPELTGCVGIEAWTTEADFTIKRAKASGALRAMHRWNEKVIEEPLPELAEAGTLEEAFAALFFEAETLDNGDLSGLRFSGKIDDWFDDLDTLWSRLAPFVHAGSFLDFEIEEGEPWRWAFNGRACRRIDLDEQGEPNAGDDSAPDELDFSKES